MDKEDQISNLKPRDQVVMRKFVNGTNIDAGVREVARVTPTQIILAPEGTYDRYHRVGGVRKFPGRSISGGASIDRLASQTDIARWEAKKAAKDAILQENENKRKSHESTRNALSVMFDAAVVNSDFDEKWSVEFHDLSESQVRRLAALVAGHPL